MAVSDMMRVHTHTKHALSVPLAERIVSISLGPLRVVYDAEGLRNGAPAIDVNHRHLELRLKLHAATHIYWSRLVSGGHPES